MAWHLKKQYIANSKNFSISNATMLFVVQRHPNDLADWNASIGKDDELPKFYHRSCVWCFSKLGNPNLV